MAEHTGTDGNGLAGELRLVLRCGLPVQLRCCGPRLSALRGVRARAVRPEDPASCSLALDLLLREQVERFEDRRLAPAVRELFGLSRAAAGAQLTERRTRAAAAAGYEVNHFRKRIEPRVLELLAFQLERDGQEIGSVPAAAPALRMGRDRLHLPADVYAWEAADHQAALARLWACAYQLRAELLALARMFSMGAPTAQVHEAADAALWRYALGLRQAGEYRGAYGALLLQEGPDREPGDVLRAAGWLPALDPAQELLLSALADPDGSRRDFVSAVRADPGGALLAATWRRAFTGPPGHDQEERGTDEH